MVTYAARATNLRHGEVEASFDGSRFTFTKTGRHTSTVESNINLKRQAVESPPIRGLDEVFTKEALEAQQLVLGFGAREIVELVANGFALLQKRAEVTKERDVYFVRIPE